MSFPIQTKLNRHLLSYLKLVFFSFCLLYPHISFAASIEVTSDTSTIKLNEIEVVVSGSSPAQHHKINSKQPATTHSFSTKGIEKLNATNTKDLAAHVPNFYIPDYGSQMTSSIYVRGSGARIDQPVVGFTFNGIPLLNKNNYDFEIYDLAMVEFLNGPQGTLYGRNTLGGLIRLETNNPFIHKYTNVDVSFSTGKTIQAKASTSQTITEKFAFSLAVNAKHTNGFFTNEYNNELCDPSNSINFHSQQVWKLNPEIHLENTFIGGLLKQGGYAYRPIDSTGIHPVNYNDECYYKRVSFIDGLTLKVKKNKFFFTSTTSYQFLDDDMFLDNDFSPKPIFTLNQKQKEHAATEELSFSSKKWFNSNSAWIWKSGVYAFYKINRMDAPVVFGEAGIDELILNNANKGLQSMFPDDRLDFKEEELPIICKFDLPTFGVAAYHQSEFKIKKWSFIAGLRFDYENAKMDYQNRTDLHYLMTLFSDQYVPFTCELNGNAQKSFFEILPKLSVQYFINKNNSIYANAAKGYKAGGFNTQIFSDILQKKLKDDLMGDMGFSLDKNTEGYDVAKAISYDPEYNWTYELGGKFDIKKKLHISAAGFFVKTNNQQLTIFPPGKNTGRMMTNAGKSRSLGCELSLFWTIFNNQHGSLHLGATYGHTNAKFVKYHDGNHDYKGKYVPFAPQNTTGAELSYNIALNNKLLKHIVLSGDWKGVGKIYWDEQNKTSQPFYSVFGASVSLETKYFDLKGWCKNLGDTEYETFRFTSVGNQFCQLGKPRQIGVSLKLKIQ